MSGGIVQLVATGAQDAWLTGKPEVSFFRSSYKRYTHYSRSVERQLIQGNPSAGNISTIRLEKKGDLFNYVYFIAKDASGALIPGVDWSKVVDKVELLIGGQIVDTQDMTWMTQVEPVVGAQNYSQRYLNNDTDGLTNVINGFFPLKFFFCKDWNVSLPLVALQYHDVELRITWSNLLNYRVGYELYSVASNSTATFPTPSAATLGIASTAAAGNPVTGSTILAAMTVTISNATLAASQRWQATAFSYSNATFQLVPGMTFATALASTPDLLVVSVTPTSTTAGTFIGYLSATSTSTSLVSASFPVKAYSSTTVTITSLSMGSASPNAPTLGTNVYTGITLGWTATSTAPVVGAVLSGFTNTFGTNTVPYISAITYTADGAATVTLTVIGTTATLGAITVGSAITTPFYQQVNMLVTSSAGVSAGQTMLGGVALQNQPTPTVNTVYSGTIISVNTNQYQSLTGPAAAAPRTAAQLDTQYTSATFYFIPTQYYTGVISAAVSTFAAPTGAQDTALAVVPQYTTVNGTNTTTSIVPPVGGTIFFVGAGQTMSNPYVQGTTSNVSFSMTCTATGSTSLVVNSQFFVFPQVACRGQIASAQPYVDREGTAIIQLQNLVGSTAIAVGQQVIGTSYDGPVTVSQVVTTSATLVTAAAGTATATIEISFPVQTKAVTTTTGAGTLIQFIDPTQPLGPGVTVSTTGFNGTYAQLQYEAWTNFVYLDQAEREYFANTPMDILFTQVNRIPIGTTNMQELALAHPIKYIAFLANNYTTSYQNQATTLIPASNYQFKTQINGVDIGDSRSMFQWMDVPHYYHTPFGYKHNGATAPVALITYCLDTSKLQPTGTLNFSRIDTYRIVAPATVSLSTLSGAAGNYFYAVNYNVLRIKDGMAGQLYSN